MTLPPSFFFLLALGSALGVPTVVHAEEFAAAPLPVSGGSLQLVYRGPLPQGTTLPFIRPNPVQFLDGGRTLFLNYNYLDRATGTIQARFTPTGSSRPGFYDGGRVQIENKPDARTYPVQNGVAEIPLRDFPYGAGFDVTVLSPSGQQDVASTLGGQFPASQLTIPPGAVNRPGGGQPQGSAGGRTGSGSSGSGASTGTRGPLVPCGQGGQPCQISQLRQLATNVFNFLMALGSIVAVGAVVVAGFRYISSRGDPGAMSDAKQKLAFAIVGLLLLLLTFVIVNTFIKAIGIKKNPLTGSVTPVQRFFA